MNAKKIADMQYQDYTIDKVKQYEDGAWQVSFDGSTSFLIPADSPVTPKPGMAMRQYGKGFGYSVRGVDLDGVEVYYRTEDGQDALHKRQVEESKAQKRKEYEEKREEFEERVNALPDEFRKRILKFREANPEFRWEFEPYELFTCEEAVKIAAHCKTEEGIRAFHGLPHEQQKEVTSDGHSGNTFGMACRLAMWYVTKPELVEKEHGALTALVGCKEYGCRH